jgi:hypothetical protein
MCRDARLSLANRHEQGQRSRLGGIRECRNHEHAELSSAPNRAEQILHLARSSHVAVVAPVGVEQQRARPVGNLVSQPRIRGRTGILELAPTVSECAEPGARQAGSGVAAPPLGDRGPGSRANEDAQRRRRDARWITKAGLKLAVVRPSDVAPHAYNGSGDVDAVVTAFVLAASRALVSAGSIGRAGPDGVGRRGGIRNTAWAPTW